MGFCPTCYVDGGDGRIGSDRDNPEIEHRGVPPVFLSISHVLQQWIESPCLRFTQRHPVHVTEQSLTVNTLSDIDARRPLFVRKKRAARKIRERPLPCPLTITSTDCHWPESIQPGVCSVQPSVTPDLVAPQPRAKQRFGFGR